MGGYVRDVLKKCTGVDISPRRVSLPRKDSPMRGSSSRRASPRRASPKAQKVCRTDQIRNPKTGRCVLRTSALGKQILRDIGSSPRRATPRKASSSPRRASPRRASLKKQKACRSDQIRNPETGRCVLKSSPKGKQILKNMG
jgi:hypothetical protein